LIGNFASGWEEMEPGKSKHKFNEESIYFSPGGEAVHDGEVWEGGYFFGVSDDLRGYEYTKHSK
jgi:hypothetical protein